MILNTGRIKFYNGFIHHSRKDGKEHFFKNKMNAIFIELINDKCKEIYKYPTLFSVNKFFEQSSLRKKGDQLCIKRPQPMPGNPKNRLSCKKKRQE